MVVVPEESEPYNTTATPCATAPLTVPEILYVSYGLAVAVKLLIVELAPLIITV